MRRQLVLAAVVLALSPGAARADDAEPECHPTSAAAVAKQWDDFAARPGVRADNASDRYECLVDDAARATACRTTARNPAHPSVIVRTVARRAGGWFIDSEATTAASCEAFRAMLKEFRAVTAKMREDFLRDRAAAEARDHD